MRKQNEDEFCVVSSLRFRNIVLQVDLGIPGGKARPTYVHFPTTYPCYR